MTDTVNPPRSRRRIGVWIAFALLVVLIIVAAAAYLLRRDIGASLAGGYLRSRGIEFGILIQELSLHGFSGRLRLGPANDPDISADQIDVDLTIAPPWSKTPFQVVAHRIHLLRPKIKLAVKDGKLSLGGLERLIGPSRPGAPSPPLPDIVFEDGTARILTTAGSLIVHGGGEIDGGRPVKLALRSEPARAQLGAWSGRFGQGVVTVTSIGASTSADLSLPVAQLDGPAADLTGATANLHFSGHLAGSGTISGHGRLTGRVEAETASQGGASARALASDLDLNLSEFGVSNGRWTLAGDGKIAASAAGLDGAGASLRGASASLQISQLKGAFDQGQWTGGADLAGAVKAAGGQGALAGAALQASDLAAGAKGRFSLSPKGLNGAATASLSVRAGLAQRDASRLAHGIAPVGDDYQHALASALAAFRLDAPRVNLTLAPGAIRVSLGTPAVLVATSGAKLDLAGDGPIFTLGQGRAAGAGVLTISGGGLPAGQLRVARYGLSGGKLDARAALGAIMDVGPVKQARIDAAGRLQLGGGQVRFDPATCINFTAERVDLGGDKLEAPSGRVCAAAGAPLIAASDASWRVQGRIEAASGGLAANKIHASGLAGAFEAASAGGAPSAKLHLDHAAIEDASVPLRFKPLSAEGDLDLDRGLWRGKFAVAAAANHPIGTVELRHDMATGEGHAVLAAPSLRFVRGGLQPADLSPLAEPLRSAQGEVAFTGLVGWGHRGLTSSGGLSTAGFDFASPLGALTGIETDLRLTSLLPVTLAPGQVVTARKLDAVIPLDGIRVVFGLDETQLAVQSGQTGAAGGQITIEPVAFPLAGDHVAHGVVVVTGIDLGKLVAASSLADKVKLDIVVDGRLPYAFGPDGFKLLDGSLVAVRPGRLAIQRDVFVGTVQPNAIQDFAYQALANLAFDSLSATVASRPGGRLGVIFHVKGRHDPAVGQEAYVGVQQLMDGSAFQKPIPLPKGTPIDLTLDTSLNFDQLLGDYQKAMAFGRAPAGPAAHSGPVQR